MIPVFLCENPFWSLDFLFLHYLVPIILVTIHFDLFIYHIFHNDLKVLHVYILLLNFIFFTFLSR